jgi:hypothetical protein
MINKGVQGVRGVAGVQNCGIPLLRYSTAPLRRSGRVEDCPFVICHLFRRRPDHSSNAPSRYPRSALSLF